MCGQLITVTKGVLMKHIVESDFADLVQFAHGGPTPSDLRQRMQEALNALNKFSVCAVTGLHVRTVFFRLLTRAILTRYPAIAKWDTLPIKRVQREAEHLSCDYPLSVGVGDVMGLNLINSLGGHAFGDASLRRVARAMLGAFADEGLECNCSRHGGDEFVFAAEITFETMMEIRARINKKVERLTIDCDGPMQNLWVDIGIASFEEAVRLFGEHIGDIGDIPIGGRVTRLVNLFVEIANARSEVIKTFERITFLVALYNNRAAFEYATKFLGKGVGALTERKIRGLAQMRDEDPARYRKMVRGIALTPKPLYHDPLSELVDTHVRNSFDTSF